MTAAVRYHLIRGGALDGGGYVRKTPGLRSSEAARGSNVEKNVVTGVADKREYQS